MTIENITVSNYGNYSNDNYGFNTIKMTDNGKTFWFSYNTLVAFQINGEFHIRENEWGPTTGKHLNWICEDKTIRENAEEFSANYFRCLYEYERKSWNQEENEEGD